MLKETRTEVTIFNKRVEESPVPYEEFKEEKINSLRELNYHEGGYCSYRYWLTGRYKVINKGTIVIQVANWQSNNIELVPDSFLRRLLKGVKGSSFENRLVCEGHDCVQLSWIDSCNITFTDIDEYECSKELRW